MIRYGVTCRTCGRATTRRPGEARECDHCAAPEWVR